MTTNRKSQAKTRAAIYARISQDPDKNNGDKAADKEQPRKGGDGLGVARQREDCLRLADRLDCHVADEHVYEDNDISAYNGKTRPDFEAMLAAMQRGEFGVLLVWHPDRLYRSLKDLVRLIEAADAGRVQIRTVNGGDLDLSTATGRMLATIVGSVAVQESEHKGERQRLANQQRRAAGEWNNAGQRPFGYTKYGQPLEPEASLLKKAATEVLRGRSLRSIAIEWNKAGVTTTRGCTWTNLQLSRMLSNPLYAALMTYERKVVGHGTWDPLLEENIHLGLVAFLSDPKRRTGIAFETKHQGSGVYRCGICGGKMYAGYPNRGKGRPTRMTYLCRPSSHVARLGEPLDAFINDLVVGRLSNPRKEDEGRLAVDGEDDGVDVVMVKAQKKALRERLNAQSRMHANGLIDDEQLASATAELKPQLEALDAVLKAQLAEEVSTDPVDEITKDGPEKVPENWAKASPNTRGKVIDRLMTVTVNKAQRGVRVFDDQYIDIEWKRRTRAMGGIDPRLALV
ncbi:recombinase family protein [Mycobacterium sp. URHB0021]